MSNHSVTLNGIDMEFSMIPRERRTVKIDVLPDGSVRAVVPIYADVEKVKRIVQKKGKWILKQRRYFEQFKHVQYHKEYVSGETHRYLNRQYRLKIIPSGNNDVKLVGGYFMIRTLRKDDPEYNKKLLYRWYREKAKTRFHRSMDDMLGKARKYGLKRPTLLIRRMKKRWGSCVPGKDKIILNLELIRAPVHCIEYVILHELIHLKYPNHGKDFYDLLSLIMLDWEERKSRLEHVTFIG